MLTKRMKRLKKFNESIDFFKASKIDYDYVYSCFAELIDDNKVEIELETENYITIRLKTQPKDQTRITNQAKQIKDKNSPIFNYIKICSTNTELLKELEVGLNRLSEEYPDYKLKFTDYINSIFIEIFTACGDKDEYATFQCPF